MEYNVYLAKLHACDQSPQVKKCGEMLHPYYIARRRIYDETASS